MGIEARSDTGVRRIRRRAGQSVAFSLCCGAKRRRILFTALPALHVHNRHYTGFRRSRAGRQNEIRPDGSVRLDQPETEIHRRFGRFDQRDHRSVLQCRRRLDCRLCHQILFGFRNRRFRNALRAIRGVARRTRRLLRRLSADHGGHRVHGH